MKTRPKEPKRVLVLGYGNPGRRDDGLGPALAERLRALDVPDIRVHSGYQLNIEDAALVAEHEVVVFADACLDSSPPFELRPVEPHSGSIQFTSHTQAPDNVLGLARSLYGASTRGFALGIRGYDFHDFGERLSAQAEKNLEAAVGFLREATLPGGALGLQATHTVETGHD